MKNKNKIHLIEGYYNIVLDLKSRKLTIKNFANYTTKTYLLCNTQVRLLLFLSDNRIKENDDIQEFVRYNHKNSVTAGISILNRKLKEINIKNIHKKGYILTTKVLIDY